MARWPVFPRRRPQFRGQSVCRNTNKRFGSRNSSTGMPEYGALKGEELYETATKAFMESHAPDGDVWIKSWCEAVRIIANVYAQIFGEGYISSLLKDDSVGHADYTEKVYLDNLGDSRYETAEGYVKAELEKFSKDELRGNHYSGVTQMLWMKRALDFMLRFLEKVMITDLEKSTVDCATESYDEVLQPYHGWLVSNIAKLAFMLCPTREKLMTCLGFSEFAVAKECLSTFLDASKPVVQRVDSVYKKYDIDFQDKV